MRKTDSATIWWLTTLALTVTLAQAACDEPLTPAQTETFEVQPLQCDPEDGLLLFESRIAPLMSPDNPPSCERCHLSGTKLSQFVQGTPCEAMACMELQGLVDLDNPEQSHILELIGRGIDPEASEQENALAMREHEAFLEWISYSAQCHQETCGVINDPCGPEHEEVVCASDDHEACGTTPREDTGPIADDYACDERGMARGFHDLVMRWRNRCNHCHAPGGALSDVGEPPLWMDPVPDEDGALRTMRNVLRTGLVDVDNPGRSLLLTKPLWVSQGGVEHTGGDKFSGFDDDSYRDFLIWLVLYSRCGDVPEDPTLVAP